MTDRRRLCGPDAPLAVARKRLVEQARAAAAAGVDLIQVRERDLEAAALASIVVELVDALRSTSARVVVNDRLDVALACGAAGVHLRADSIPPASARSIAPDGFLVGRSVHSAAEARAVSESVDYLIAGTVFATPSKPPDHALLGVSGLAAIARAVPVPVLAIGGVTVEQFDRLAGAGAAGFAAIGLFLQEAGPAVRAWFDAAGSAS
ncbi:MAG: thiamine phosphate synthase [Betaproteobacteria bacterium]